eukprot:6561302-Prymnesium_polylepis.1
MRDFSLLRGFTAAIMFRFDQLFSSVASCQPLCSGGAFALPRVHDGQAEDRRPDRAPTPARAPRTRNTTDARTATRRTIVLSGDAESPRVACCGR